MLRFSRLVWISLIAMVVLAACSPRTHRGSPNQSPSGSHFCACRNFCARSHRCASRNYRARRDCCAIWLRQATAHWLYPHRRPALTSRLAEADRRFAAVARRCEKKLAASSSRTARCTCRR